MMTRKYVTENTCYVHPIEIESTKPRGIIIYSTPFYATTAQLFDLMNDPNYSMCMHAIIDNGNVMTTLPFTYRGAHAGTKQGNDNYIGVMMPDIPDTGIDRTVALWTLQIFLAYYVIEQNISIDEIQNFILSMGVAHKLGLVTDTVYNAYSGEYHYFSKQYLNDQSASIENFQGIITRVKEIVGQVRTIKDQIAAEPFRAENKTTEARRGEVVIFDGGSLFKTRGASTRQTSNGNLFLVVIAQVAPRAKHPYEVVFQSGEKYWVNKTSIESF